MSARPHDFEHWPDYYQRRWDWSAAIGELWVALAEHPLLSRIPMLRRNFERKAARAFSQASRWVTEVRELIREADR